MSIINIQGKYKNPKGRVTKIVIEKKQSQFSIIFVPASQYRVLAVAQWLRCCATNRKVTGSIPDGAIGISH